MKNIGKIFLTQILFGAIIILSFQCKKKTAEEVFIEKVEMLASLSESRSFNSIEELQQTILSTLQNGSEKDLARLLVDQKMFQEFYPFTEEGRSDNALSADEFFNAIINQRRVNSLLSQYNSFKENKYRVKKIGNPKKTQKLGPWTLYKYIPLSLATLDKDGKEVIDFNEDLFGAIIEKDGKFYWLNVFRG